MNHWYKLNIYYYSMVFINITLATKIMFTKYSLHYIN